MSSVQTSFDKMLHFKRDLRSDSKICYKTMPFFYVEQNFYQTIIKVIKKLQDKTPKLHPTQEDLVVFPNQI